MSLRDHVPLALIRLGGAAVVGALIWWGLTFWPTVSNDYLSLKEAGCCLVADSSICRLATSVCGTRHAALVVAYSPIALWLGATIAFGGLFAVPSRRVPV